MDLKPGQPTEVGEAFRFVTKVGAIFMAPLIVRGRFEGRIAVASDSQLPGDIRYVLETLGSQVALALERNALAGELYQRRGDERFRKLVQNSSDLITMLDTNSSIQYISPSVEQVLGYGPEEKIGLDVFEVIHPGDRTRCKKAFAKLLRRTGRPGIGRGASATPGWFLAAHGSRGYQLPRRPRHRRPGAQLPRHHRAQAGRR